MVAIKVYNNNAVATVYPDGREAILVGSGIGFGRRPGDTIDEKKIQKIYFIQDDLQTRFLQLLKNTRPEAMQAAEDTLAYARSQGLTLKDQLILSLSDHISFALERLEQGITLPYLMMSETRLLYPKEFEIGLWTLDRIRALCGAALPEYEAGYIALQLASILMNLSAGVERTQWPIMLALGVVQILVYFFLFSFLIKKFNYKTPGREDDLTETKNDKTPAKTFNGSEDAKYVVEGLGGKDNINTVENCFTCLRVNVKDVALVNDELINKAPNSGIIKKGNDIQIVFGLQVADVRKSVEDYLQTL